MIRVLTFLLVIYLSSSNVFAQENATNQLMKQTTETGSSDSHPANPDKTTEEAPFVVGKPAIIQAQPVTPSTTPDTAVKTEAPKDDKTDNTKTPSVPDIETPHSNYTSGVLLEGLNKITARTSRLEVKTGDSIRFGNLNIILHACWKSPPEEDPESKALIEMWEEIPGEPRKKIFSGWMFASSPLISAPEHPVYDVTVLECTGEPIKINYTPAAAPTKVTNSPETAPAKVTAPAKN